MFLCLFPCLRPSLLTSCGEGPEEFQDEVLPIAKAQMDEGRWTASVEMAWFLRYLSVIWFFCFRYRKSEIVKHLTDDLPAMDAKGIRTALSSFCRPRSHLTLAACDWILSLASLARDEDIQAYFDAVQQRKTALEAACLTFTFVVHIQGFLGGTWRSGDRLTLIQDGLLVLDDHRRSQPPTKATLNAIRT
eukprot:scaffold55220_cov19-Prasinocladus_malaysianus.AAC.1